MPSSHFAMLVLAVCFAFALRLLCVCLPGAFRFRGFPGRKNPAISEYPRLSTNTPGNERAGDRPGGFAVPFAAHFAAAKSTANHPANCPANTTANVGYTGGAGEANISGGAHHAHPATVHDVTTNKALLFSFQSFQILFAL